MRGDLVRCDHAPLPRRMQRNKPAAFAQGLPRAGRSGVPSAQVRIGESDEVGAALKLLDYFRHQGCSFWLGDHLRRQTFRHHLADVYSPPRRVAFCLKTAVSARPSRSCGWALSVGWSRLFGRNINTGWKPVPRFRRGGDRHAAPPDDRSKRTCGQDYAGAPTVSQTLPWFPRALVSMPSLAATRWP